MNSRPPLPLCDDPFADDVFGGDLGSCVTAGFLYADELASFQRMIASLRTQDSSLGNGPILLRAPKAGAGKSHFLARLARATRGKATVVQLPLDDVSQLNWPFFFKSVLQSLHQQSDPHREGATLLEGQACQLFRRSASQLMSQGTVPSEISPRTWFAGNRRTYIDRIDSSDARTRWFTKHFSKLEPQLVTSFSRATELEPEWISRWVHLLHDYACVKGGTLQSLPQPSEDPSRALGDLTTLGRLLSLEAPFIFVFDDLDWFYRDHDSILRLAKLLTELNHLIPCSLTILSVNQDLWEESFCTGLPEAVVDRLTQNTVQLNGIPMAQVKRFLEAYLTGVSLRENEHRSFVERVSARCADASFVTPRTLMREASQWWNRLPDAPPNTETYVTGTVVDEVSSAPTATSKASEEEAKVSTTQWTSALEDIRQLISAREQPEKKKDEPAIPSHGVDGEALSSALNGFIAKLKSRADGKEDYLPQSAANRPSRRFPAQATTGTSKEDEDTQRITVTANDPVQSTDKRWLSEQMLALKRVAHEKEAVRSIDLPRLNHLITTAGALFPAINQVSEVLPGTTDEICSWRFQYSEIFFNFASPDRKDFWKILIQHTARKARERESERVRVKLCVFRHEEKSSWLEGIVADLPHEDRHYCDEIVLSSAELGVIHSISEMLGEIDDPDAREKQFIEQSNQLDFLWKMITRPLWIRQEESIEVEEDFQATSSCEPSLR